MTLRASVSRPVHTSVLLYVGDSFRESIHNSVLYSVRESIYNSVYYSVSGAVVNFSYEYFE